MAVRYTATSPKPIANTTPTPSASIAEQAHQVAANTDPQKPWELAVALMGLCAQVRTWKDWHAVYQAGEQLPPSLHGCLTDKLDPLLIANACQWLADGFGLVALGEVFQRQPEGERAALVRQFTAKVQQQINTLMNACCGRDVDEPSVRSTQQVLSTWQPLACHCSSLQSLIQGAQSYLESLTPAPSTAAPSGGSFAQRTQACIDQYANKPYQLTGALYALTQEIRTWQDWLSLHQASKRLVGSAHEALAEKLATSWQRDWSGRIADANGLSEEERQLTYAFCQSLPPSPQRDALIQTLPGPVLPSGGGLQTLLAPQRADTITHIWPLIINELVPPLARKTPMKAIAASLRSLNAISRTNRWFHGKTQGVLPAVAIRLMQHTDWFMHTMSANSPLERWTRLPLHTFLQWTEGVQSSGSPLPAEDRLLLLLNSVLHHFLAGKTQVFDVLDPLWDTYFSSAGPLGANHRQLPRLFAQAIVHTPFVDHIFLSPGTARVVAWLQKRLDDMDPSLALPAWAELGIGIQEKLVAFHYAPRQSRNWFDDTRHRSISRDAIQRLQRLWPEADQGVEGMAAVLLESMASFDQRPLPPASEPQRTNALLFMSAFSRQHPLQGSLRVALDFLQHQASRHLLTAQQNELLSDCLKNDAAHRKGDALAIA